MTEEDKAPPKQQAVAERTRKSCVRCGVVGGDESFYRTKEGAFVSYCKPCWKIHSKKSKQDRMVRDPEGFRAMERRIRLAKYGLTVEDYDTMLALQGGVCACCGQPETYRFRGRVAPLAVDHDHDCCSASSRSCGSCIRGLLCRGCNMAIGSAKNDPKTLRALADYLERLR